MEYTLRMKVVPMTSGEQRLVHGVGLAWTFFYAALSSTAGLSSSYTARCLGPPFTAS